MMSLSLSVRNSPSFQSPAAARAVDVAAQSDLLGARDHLVERRIGDQEAFQQAGPQRIGTAELERRRRAVGLRISGVERHQLRQDLVGEADDRVEPLERVLGIEVGAGAEQIGHRDLRDVVASSSSHRQPIGNIEGVVDVDAIVGIPGAEADRAEADIAGGVDDLSRPRHRRVRTNEEIGIDVAELAVGLEADLAAVDAAADGEVVVVTEYLVVVEALQRGARGHRIGPGAIDRAPWHAGAGVSRSRRAVDGPVVLVEKLEVRLRLGRKPVILQAQRIEQWIARLPAATLDIGSVAVNMGLLEFAVIEIALHRPVVGDRVATVHRDQLRLVFCGLRPSVDRAVIVVEKIDRGRPDHAEIVVGDRRNEVDLGVRPSPAEIAVEAREPRRRLVAPAVILEAFGGEIEPPLALAHAVLQRAADAAVGAAGRIDFEAVIGEAVLHLQVDGAAQCVEAEGGVVGPDVGAADGNRRDQVPVDGIAEGFVDADALHVDGEPLRGALQRGGGKAAIAQVLDEAVALNVRGDDAGDALRQGLDHAGGIHAREVIGGERLHHRRHLAAIKADAGHRRGRDDLTGQAARWGRGAAREQPAAMPPLGGPQALAAAADVGQAAARRR